MKYMMGDCEPGFEFSEMAVDAMQGCGYSCLNPTNWYLNGKSKASVKSKAQEGRASKAKDSDTYVDPQGRLRHAHGKLLKRTLLQLEIQLIHQQEKKF